MNFKEFKEKCCEEKRLQNLRIFYWKQLREGQSKYIDECIRPKGWIFKKCPVCNNGLKCEVIDDCYIIYSCNCGYEYATYRPI